MALPENNTPWPPPALLPYLREMEEHDAWHASDMERLANFYYKHTLNPMGSNRLEAGTLSDYRRHLVHVPMPADISATSASHLFSEHPQIDIPEAHEENAAPDAVAAQDRLTQILADSGAFATLLEAAQISSALGGIYLKVNWDREQFPYPILNVAQPDRAAPEFTFGRLSAVTFWQELETEGNDVYRILERHEPGYILTGLYRGTSEKLGEKVSLQNRAETAGTAEVIATELPGLAARYIPNIRPNRMHRGSALGASDYQGLTGLFESLDDTYTSLLRDIRLGRARLLVPEAYVQQDSAGNYYLDMMQEVITPVTGVLGGDTEGLQIEATQFAIRAEEHAAAARQFMERIITGAGLAPQSFGLEIEGQAESGTALRLRERKSLITAAKKSEYWRPALEDLCQMLLMVDKAHLGGSGYEALKPTVAIQDSIVPDISELASSVDMINRAQAASVETRVRLLHPDWEDARVTAETERILDEQGLQIPDLEELDQA